MQRMCFIAGKGNIVFRFFMNLPLSFSPSWCSALFFFLRVCVCMYACPRA